MAITVTIDSTAFTDESFGINIRRGRNRSLDEFESVSGTVAFRNYSASFLDAVLPGQSLTIDDGAVRVFSGHVEDVQFLYDRSRYADVRIMLGDGMTTLGNSFIQDEFTATDNQLPGVRLAAILDRADIDFPTGVSARSLANGQSRLGDDVVPAGTNALRYCQLVAVSEFGKLYIDRSGVLQFKGRYDFPSASPAAEFDDEGTNFGFSGIQPDYSTELFKSSASVSRVGDAEQRVRTATGTAIAAALGTRNLAVNGLLLRHDGDVRARAAFLADKYSTLPTLISSLEVLLDPLGTSDRATITALDINDTVTVLWTPFGPGGSPAQKDLTLVIEGVEYVSDVGGLTKMRFQLSDYPETDYMFWDTDDYDSATLYAH